MNKKKKSYGFATRAIHSGAAPEPITGARNTPIYQTTSYVFKNTEHAERLFKLEDFGAWVASKTGMPAELVRSQAEKEQVIQAGAQAEQAGMKTSERPMPQQ